MKKNSKLLYTAAVLTSTSKNMLLSYFSSSIPIGWKNFGHHMTIKFGSDNEKYKDLVGKKVELEVDKIGFSDMAIAVEVSGCPSENKIPHITLAINQSEGAKPYMSNEITKWINVTFKLKLDAEVKEIWS